MWRAIKGLFWCGVFVAVNMAFLSVLALSVIYQKLPLLDALEDYRPRLPMRIYTSDEKLIGEFGKEKRSYRHFREFPRTLVDALLVTEDSRFFEHRGLDFWGIARAVLGYFEGRREGASTITMQVARNFYLTRERTLMRKITEMLISLEIESRFSKQEILERYMNQIYLGHGAFGFAAASRIYYNKAMDELTVAEIALLAGLPKAPSTYNPRRNLIAAKERQSHVLRRMLDGNIINEKLYLELVSADLPPLRRPAQRFEVEASFVAEEVRRLVFATFGEDAYERGIKIYTTLQSHLQNAAVRAVRQGLISHESRRKYIGPEKFIDIRGLSSSSIADKLSDESTVGNLMPAAVVAADKKSLSVVGKNGETYKLTGESLGALRRHLPGGGRKPEIAVGAVVRLLGDGKDVKLVAPPGAEAALVALSPEDGAVLAMAGGFDFNRNQFNHVTQARRQPGSSIKPFIYSAALEKGFTPASILPDTPIFLSAAETGSGKSWEPRNYDGKATGPILLRTALAKSKNLAAVQLLKFIDVLYAQDYVLKFGFRKQDVPPYLTMGLGAGAATPMEIARAYAVFANGGFRVNHYLITRMEDYDGNHLVNELNFAERRRIIDGRNAFIMTSLLQSAVNEGTGASAKRALQRTDLAGKTGTTNGFHDAWFAGFGGNVVAVSWIGYDQLRSLGKKETGARAALPIWIDFMKTALKGRSEVEYLPPPGIIIADIDRESGRLLSAGESDKGRREYFYQELLPTADAPPLKQDIEDLF
ncbi:MAG: penicillin-binding protein 1A [Gammaproteobacteria bacterium WSBS_2016_MAG_OTU1]